MKFTASWLGMLLKVARGARYSAVVRALASHQCGGFESWRRRLMWVFVVGSLPCSERFFSGFSGFPLSLKTNTSKFQFDLVRTGTFQRLCRTLKCSVGKRITKKIYKEKVIFIRKRQSTLEILIRSFSRNGANIWNLIPFDWRDASKSVF